MMGPAGTGAAGLGGAAEVDWSRLTARDLVTLAEANAAVILPIASIEQHGPHLPVMTDTRLGHEIALRAARRASPTRPTVVAPPVWSGLSEHHMAFGGTLSISHATFRALIADLVACLVRLRFRDILIANSHGGNENAMRQIIDELAPTSPATLVGVLYSTEAALEIEALLDDQTGLDHACEGETAMMMAVEPDLVDTRDLGALGGVQGGKMWETGHAAYRWRPMHHGTSDGVTGVPARATAAKGEALIEASAEALARLILDPQSWAPIGDKRRR